MRRVLLSVGVFTLMPLLGGVLTGCAVNPATGERQLSLISESQEIRMGQEADPEIVSSLGLYPDEDLQAYVQRLGRALADSSERPDLPWTFRLIDDPAVNAFAVPGGFIYITRGIFGTLNSEAELVGVLGHEIGHVTARHSVNQMSKQQIQQLGLGIGVMVVEDLQEYSGLLQTGLALLNLKYSRDDESQADRLGFRYMTELHYDPYALVGVFETLALVSGSTKDRLPEWESTHPYPENRRDRVSNLIAGTGIDFSGYKRSRNGYVRRMNGLVYGEDPRQGFFQDGTFHHPELAFRFTIPAGWEGVNRPAAVGAIAPEKDAILVLSIPPDAASPRAALDSFLAQEGIEAGAVSEATVHGLPAARAPFTAATREGEVAGEALFLTYGDRVYQMLGYGAAGSWSRQSQVVRAAMESFREETDPSVLAVEPARIEVVEIPRAMTLEEFSRAYPSTITLEELSLINRLDPAGRLETGSLAKRVTGGRSP
jgi:predicted Zn-dependent protease